MAVLHKTAPTPSNRPSRADRRRRWVSLEEVAEYLGITKRTVRQMVADGRLTAYRDGPRFVRLVLDVVDAAMTPFGGAA